MIQKADGRASTAVPAGVAGDRTATGLRGGEHLTGPAGVVTFVP
ncbi:hypothetical protein [Streptosporangium sp. NPDC051022]